MNMKSSSAKKKRTNSLNQEYLLENITATNKNTNKNKNTNTNTKTSRKDK